MLESLGEIFEPSLIHINKKKLFSIWTTWLCIKPKSDWYKINVRLLFSIFLQKKSKLLSNNVVWPKIGMQYRMTTMKVGLNSNLISSQRFVNIMKTMTKYILYVKKKPKDTRHLLRFLIINLDQKFWWLRLNIRPQSTINQINNKLLNIKNNKTFESKVTQMWLMWHNQCWQHATISILHKIKKEILQLIDEV